MEQPPSDARLSYVDGGRPSLRSRVAVSSEISGEGESLASFSVYVGDGIAAKGVVVDRAGAIVISEITVTSAARSGVNASALRKIATGEILEAVGSALRGFARWTQVELVSDTGEPEPSAASAARKARLERLAEAGTRAGGGGRPRMTDDELRSVAVEFLELQKELGARGGVIGELARRRDKPLGTVRDWVRRASAAGFLDTAVQGRGGRLPGPRLSEGDAK